MNRSVSEIRPLDQKRRVVSFDDGMTVPVYLGELRRYHLEEGAVLSETDFDELISGLKKRVRLRCMHILQKSDKTESQLRQKLREGGYPPFLIEDALDYVKGYHYVDDRRYASYYVSQQGKKRSVKRLRQDLRQKGISEELIEAALDSEKVDEEESILAFARKKITSLQPSTPEDWQKVYRYLASKGYEYGQICRTISRLRGEEETLL